jgi:hypothetical protein
MGMAGFTPDFTTIWDLEIGRGSAASLIFGYNLLVQL